MKQNRGSVFGTRKRENDDFYFFSIYFLNFISSVFFFLLSFVGCLSFFVSFSLKRRGMWKFVTRRPVGGKGRFTFAFARRNSYLFLWGNSGKISA